MSVLDWLSDTGLFGGGSGGFTDPMAQQGAGIPPTGAPPAQMPPATAPPIQPQAAPPGPSPAPASPPQGAMPTPGSLDPNSPQFTGPVQDGSLPAPSPGAPGPMPPQVANANAAAPPPPAPAPAAQPPGPPLNITSAAQNAPPPGFNPSILGRAFNVTSADQAAKYGQQMGSGLAAGLKSVGQNWNKPGLAAFAGSAGAAMEGGQTEAKNQRKEAADYLKSAIEAKKAGDEAGYKQNYLQYLAAKLKSDTDKAASKEATNKNDTPTQLYLSAQRLVQNDPEVVDARKALESARKTGEPADVTAATNRLQQVIQQKQAQHLQGVGLNPQTAATLAKQPGNSQENPINGKDSGLTADNIGKKLQPGQWFTNPADGRVLQYKGPPKKDEKAASVPDKPTNPEPANPMNKSEVSNGSTGGKTSKDDDDEE
jgi:hypothetical protein